MNDWNIQTRAHQCQACGKGFEDKTTYHTLLFDDEREGFVRRDICGSCWKSEFEGGTSQEGGYISYWQGTYEAPPPAPPEPIQKENAESLLRRLIDLNNPAFSDAGYILAVMLERKRQLKIKEQFSRDGRRVFVYEQPKSGDLFTIIDPALQLNQLEAVQKQVADLLEFGLTDTGEIAYPLEPESPSENLSERDDGDSDPESPSKASADDMEPFQSSSPAGSETDNEKSEQCEHDENEDEEEEEYDDEEDEEDEFDDEDEGVNEDEDEDAAEDSPSASVKDSKTGEPSFPR